MINLNFMGKKFIIIEKKNYEAGKQNYFYIE